MMLSTGVTLATLATKPPANSRVYADSRSIEGRLQADRGKRCWYDLMLLFILSPHFMALYSIAFTVHGWDEGT